MAHIPYPYKQVRSRRYVFISDGTKKIQKIVDFVPLGIGNILNLGFGDLRADDSIDDKINSNNGDLVRVLATVVAILKDYTNRHPNAVIYFKGSTKDRTKLYGRILRSYYQLFSRDFTIMAVAGNRVKNETALFDPEKAYEYLAFLVKRIS